MKNYKIRKENKKVVVHDFINQTMLFKDCPHEWYFIEALKEEIMLNSDLATIFAMFVLQYYPDYPWTTFDIHNLLNTLLIEISIHCMRFKYVFNGVEPKENLDKAMKFGDMATEFLIRYCGYSLIKSCNQKVIITSRGDCDKYFESFLLDGYSLYRLAKLSYQKLLLELQAMYPYIDGIFHKRPVLPTKELYGNQEVIEDSYGGFVTLYDRGR